MLSHIFNIPFPFLCATLRPDFTAITVIKLSDEPDPLVVPRIEIANDSRHIHATERVTYH